MELGSKIRGNQFKSLINLQTNIDSLKFKIFHLCWFYMLDTVFEEKQNQITLRDYCFIRKVLWNLNNSYGRLYFSLSNPNCMQPSSKSTFPTYWLYLITYICGLKLTMPYFKFKYLPLEIKQERFGCFAM